jgi:sporulation protein YlmC with PRC-barrel domain
MPEQNIRKTDPDKKYRRVLSGSSLTGDRVKNPEGEDLGKIDEIMIDVPTGRVAYAVVSFGGVLGMGAKLFAIPWTSFTLDEDNKCFLLNVPKDRLKAAPGFDKDNWPDMADPTWRSDVYSYYGARPYWEEEKTFRGGGGV